MAERLNSTESLRGMLCDSVQTLYGGNVCERDHEHSGNLLQGCRFILVLLTLATSNGIREFEKSRDTDVLSCLGVCFLVSIPQSLSFLSLVISVIIISCSALIGDGFPSFS